MECAEQEFVRNLSKQAPMYCLDELSIGVLKENIRKKANLCATESYTIKRQKLLFSVKLYKYILTQ